MINQKQISLTIILSLLTFVVLTILFAHHILSIIWVICLCIYKTIFLLILYALQRNIVLKTSVDSISDVMLSKIMTGTAKTRTIRESVYAQKLREYQEKKRKNISILVFVIYILIQVALIFYLAQFYTITVDVFSYDYLSGISAPYNSYIKNTFLVYFIILTLVVFFQKKLLKKLKSH
jgi:hypothetical protein